MKNHYGRIYFAAERMVADDMGKDRLVRFYRAVIWSGEDGRSLWESTSTFVGLDNDPEAAFQRMEAHAPKIGGAVDLFRNDGSAAGTVGA